MTRNSQLSRSIRGSVALITGAGSGMGRATAHLFADEGARVAILDINETGLERVAGEIREAGGDVFSIAVDCAQQSQVTRAVEQAAAHFGALDILVNNAGLVLPLKRAGQAH